MYEPPNEKEETISNPTKYQSLIGSLLYISRMTRPDIPLHVSLLGRRTANPGKANLQAALQLAQYLASTKEEGLILRDMQQEMQKVDLKEVPIAIYADASYEGENSRSQSGSLVTLYGKTPVTGVPHIYQWYIMRYSRYSMTIT